MGTVCVNPPKTPVTKSSTGIAMATVPNVCKMPGPPAPFVPTPLPNIGKSGMSPDGYSTTVTFDGAAVAIQGASFGSMGDVASKGTGGGLLSANTQGPTKFIAPGSLTVLVEGKNVQLLGDQMMNNCGPGGSPMNAATMQGVTQPPLVVPPVGNPPELDQVAKDCEQKVENDVKAGKLTSTGKAPSCAVKGTWKHKCCKDAIEAKGYPNVACETPAAPGCRLDVLVTGPTGASHIFDYKFGCPGPASMSSTQLNKYTKAFPTATISTVVP